MPAACINSGNAMIATRLSVRALSLLYRPIGAFISSCALLHTRPRRPREKVRISKTNLRCCRKQSTYPAMRAEETRQKPTLTHQFRRLTQEILTNPSTAPPLVAPAKTAAEHPLRHAQCGKPANLSKVRLPPSRSAFPLFLLDPPPEQRYISLQYFQGECP